MKKKILFFIFSFFIIQSVQASSLYNFSNHRIYFTATSPTQKGQVKSFQIKTLDYEDKSKITVYVGQGIQRKSCELDVTNRFDVFIQPYGINTVKCSLRAARLPKEY